MLVLKVWDLYQISPYFFLFKNVISAFIFNDLMNFVTLGTKI